MLSYSVFSFTGQLLSRLMLTGLGLFASLSPALNTTIHSREQAVPPADELARDGTNSYVYDLLFDKNGLLYVGGTFNLAGGLPASGVATWDGVRWGTLGKGLTVKGAPIGTVYAMAMDSAGNLYVGGNFTQAGEVLAYNVAKWDGTAWTALGDGTMRGNGVKGPVHALAVDRQGNLYAGGDFRGAGTIAAANVVKWDGKTWQTMGSGLPHGCWTLTVDRAGTLYAGGSFERDGDTKINFVARWTGSEWKPLGGGVDDIVNTLASDTVNNLYVGGRITKVGQVTCQVARWDGKRWQATSPTLGRTINALALGKGGTLYAGGTFTRNDDVMADYIAKWDGSTWATLGTGINNAVETVAVDKAGNVYAGGQFRRGNGGAGNFIAKWNGRSWEPLLNPAPRVAAPTKPAPAKSKPR